MSYLDDYRAAQAKWPGAIVLIKLGDFWEAFDESARTLAKRIGLTLTSRSQRSKPDEKLDMCGFPYHQYHNYLTQLVKCGFRVVVLRGKEEPRTAATIEELNNLV